MKKLVFLTLLSICGASEVLTPRGGRPVEQGTRSEKCAAQKEWPFCTSDQWGPKCPSGCRIAGLINSFDHDAQSQMEKIRRLLDQNKAKYRTTDLMTKQTYDYLKEKLTSDAGQDNRYFDLAQNLRHRISEMKVKIDRQLGQLAALRDRVKDQVTEIQRLEIDIDIKLRSCAGSCKTYNKFTVDQESYTTLNKQVRQLHSTSTKDVDPVGTMYVMKSRQMHNVVVDSRFKSKDVDAPDGGVQLEILFNEVPPVQLVLEHEGSSPSSAATISKDSGTSSSSSSSFSSSTSKSRTELSGGGSDSLGGGMGGGGAHGGHGVTTSTHTCTTSVQTVVRQTASGPVEETEVVRTGPGCDTISDLNGSFGNLFPSLTSSSSSSSSSFSSSSSSGGTKGSLLDTKTDFGNPFGLDHGLFGAGADDDDQPDVHARSLTSTHTERSATHVASDCADARRHHLNGKSNGLFRIRPGGVDSAPVETLYCRQDGLMGGWLLAQQRQSGAFGFNRTWAEYAAGFGAVDASGDGEFWLGNRKLHLLSRDAETMLRVELEDWDGASAVAEYVIRVGAERDGFPLTVSGYTGDAGDALNSAHSNGGTFCSFDREGCDCAASAGGGWWRGSCDSANLNRASYSGANEPRKLANVWTTHKPTNLKTVRMLIRPTAF